MRIKGYTYPGFALCCHCDPHKADDERHPVFEHEEGSETFSCDKCKESFADTAGEVTDAAYCFECGGDKGDGKALCAACDEAITSDDERRLLKKHGY